MSEGLDPARCPICGDANACAMARPDGAGRAGGAGACWCNAVALDPAVLRQVGEAARGRACVCRRCAAAGSGADGAACPAPPG